MFRQPALDPGGGVDENAAVEITAVQIMVAGSFVVAGVPAHPLLVHAVVVLIPLAAVGAVAVAARPAWERAYGPLVAALALAGAVSATLARFAGQQLEDLIEITPGFQPVIDQHESFGLFTMWASWPFALLAVAATVLVWRGRESRGSPVRVVGALAAVAGIVAVVATVLAGHSGSAAVWADVVSG